MAGVAAGITGALVMAMFAMIAAATYHGTGFFTPMYHIASSVIAPDTMMESAAQAQAGNLFYFEVWPAALGMALHLAVGAPFGALFPFVGRVVGVRGPAWIGLGVLYGAVVLALMAFVGLPIAAAVFGGGDPIGSMPAMAGWWTFAIEHLMFGAVLGVWFARSRRRVEAAG
ncbi:MAG TPA: hypothetical protein VG709_04440 [Actinomycetota bacterium]|nr:hypothetical protein [Actinomycetota bacterium]